MFCEPYCTEISEHFSLQPLVISLQPPWYPPSWYPGIPTPAPVQRAEQEFEKKIKKAVPKIPMLSNDPKLKYVGFKEIGTG